jgi:hypothetical protein
MLNLSSAQIMHVISHHVGNPTLDEELTLSNSPLMKVSEETEMFLTQLIASPFVKNAHILHRFRHSSNLELNEVYTYSKLLFESENEVGFEVQDEFVIQSQSIARQLYAKSTHPKIKSGEVVIAYLKGIIWADEETEGIAIIKLGHPEQFVQLEHANSLTKIDHFRGIGLGTVEKGALILNTHKQEGFVIAIEDKASDKDGSYWAKEFLNTSQLENSFFHTYAYLGMVNDFVENVLPDHFEVSKLEKFGLKKKAIDFFSEKETFDYNEFAKDVLQQPEIIDRFNAHKEETAQNVAQEFHISDKATKTQKKHFQRIIKLDKNFHIHVNGNNELIEKGVDEATGMNFYKIYFNSEA